MNYIGMIVIAMVIVGVSSTIKQAVDRNTAAIEAAANKCMR
jgi:hypothetical protein